MTRRVSTLLLAIASFPAAAHAAPPIQFDCDLEMSLNGRHVTHRIVVDLDHATIQDGPMRWTDGGPAEPVALDNLIAFVRHKDGQVAWGNQTRQEQEAVSVFYLDLATGAYTYTSRLGRPAEGRCHPIGGAI